MSNKIEMTLADGTRIAGHFLNQTGYLDYAVLAGSIRRMRPTVHDVDIVYRGTTDDFLSRSLRARCIGGAGIAIIKWGPKLAAIIYHGVPIDLYFSTPETFPTLLLIRTGSKENNFRLCSIAKAKGWKLHASGEGLFNGRGERIAGDSERSIYDALGVPWQEPWERG